MKRKFLTLGLAGIILASSLLTGCAGKDQNTAETENPENTEMTENAGQSTEDQKQTGIAGESASASQIDAHGKCQHKPEHHVKKLIPFYQLIQHGQRLSFDDPILQSEEADDYYETRDAYGKDSASGALYTELANLKNMCDFNTVIHGRGDSEAAPFAGLYDFADPDFFEKHEYAYVYIDGNLLTYEIFAAYEREDTSLIRTYDFTYQSGCQQFIDDLYGTRIMGMNLRESFGEVSPYNFLITLTTKKDAASDKQFVVIAALVGDAAGTIDRVVE